MKHALLFLLLVLAFRPGVALAKNRWDVIIGPPSVGQGGSNPVSVPPVSPVDWQVTWVNADNREWCFSIVPGILYGQRWTHENLFMSLGGGVVVSPDGLGLGAYHALGMETEEFAKNWRMVFEYRQAAGVGESGMQFPYTVRIGVSYAP